MSIRDDTSPDLPPWHWTPLFNHEQTLFNGANLAGRRPGTARLDNPYQAWIDTYADEAFAEGVRKVIAISDQVAEAAGPTMRDQMSGAFVRAAQRVWIFWDSAHRLERWPV